jgi:hypothetical protein
MAWHVLLLLLKGVRDRLALATDAHIYDPGPSMTCGTYLVKGERAWGSYLDIDVYFTKNGEDKRNQ